MTFRKHEGNISESMEGGQTSTVFTLDVYNSSEEYIQLRFVQLEHRGGFCDCWDIHDLVVVDNLGSPMNLE